MYYVARWLNSAYRLAIETPLVIARILQACDNLEAYDSTCVQKSFLCVWSPLSLAYEMCGELIYSSQV